MCYYFLSIIVLRLTRIILFPCFYQISAIFVYHSFTSNVKSPLFYLPSSLFYRFRCSIVIIKLL